MRKIHVERTGTSELDRKYDAAMAGIQANHVQSGQRAYLHAGEIRALDWIREHAPPGAAIQPLPWIARAPDGGVLFHCHAGKDRTGLVAALLLALAGTPDEIIAQDYHLSYTYLLPTFDEWLGELTTSALVQPCAAMMCWL